MPLDPDEVAELAELRHAIEALGQKLDELRHSSEEVMSAFPDGPQAHRKAHEAMISAAKAQEAFWSELKLDIAKKGIWATLILVLGLVIVGLQQKYGLK